MSNDFRFPLQKIRKFAIDFTPSEKTAFVASIQLSYYYLFFMPFFNITKGSLLSKLSHEGAHALTQKARWATHLSRESKLGMHYS